MARPETQGTELLSLSNRNRCNDQTLRLDDIPVIMVYRKASAVAGVSENIKSVASGSSGASSTCSA